MTFGQFVFVDSYFNNFSETGSPEDLNKFLASLYTPYNGKFKQGNIDNHVRFGKLSNEIKEAVLINYMLVKQWLFVKYPLLFIAAVIDEEPSKHKTKNNYDSMGWVKILENLIGDDIPNHRKYTNLPLHNVLRFLTRKIKESAKHK